MLKKHVTLSVAIFMALALILSACGGSTPPPATTTAAAAATTTAAAAATTTAAAAATTTAAAATTTAAAAAATTTAAAATTTAAAATTTAAPAASGEYPGGFSGVNEFPIVKETVELTFFCAPSASIESMDDNEFTKWYFEKTNVKINFDAVPAQARLERLNLILAADDLPDVIFGAGVTRDDEMVFGPRGKFVDLTPLIDQHGFYIKEMFEQVPYSRAGIIAADGKIYSLPQVNECFHCIYGNSRHWVNRIARDELGLTDPTTTEELREFLRAFKDAGYIPLTGHIETNRNSMNRLTRYIVNSFQFVPDANESLTIVDGKVIPCYITDDFREGLRFANSLYAEGLIDPTTFTNTSDELRQMCEDPSGNFVGVSGGWWFGTLGSLEGDRHTEFDILLPVAGPAGKAYSTYEPYRHSTGQYIITDRCKYPEVAFKYADFLYSDEAAVRYIECGREGIEWRVPSANELDFYDRPAARARIDDIAYGENTNVHYYQMGPSFRSFEYRESWWRGAGSMYDKDAYEYRLHVYTVPMTKYRPNMTSLRVYPPTYAAEADANELKRILPNIYDHRQMHIDAFITGQRNIETDWDAYIAGFKALEIDLYIEIKQRAYDNSDFMNSVPVPGNPNAPISFAELFNN